MIATIEFPVKFWVKWVKLARRLDCLFKGVGTWQNHDCLSPVGKLASSGTETHTGAESWNTTGLCHEDCVCPFCIWSLSLMGKSRTIDIPGCYPSYTRYQWSEVIIFFHKIIQMWGPPSFLDSIFHINIIQLLRLSHQKQYWNPKKLYFNMSVKVTEIGSKGLH